MPAAANGFNIFLLKRFFDSIPRELIEAAQIDGAGPLRVLWSVVLPISRPILGVVSIFTIVTVLQGLRLAAAGHDRQRQDDAQRRPVADRGHGPQNAIMGGLVVASVPTIIVFFIFQRHIMAGLTAGSIKG